MLTHQLVSVTGSMRSLAANGIVLSIDDSGAAQTATVKTHDGVVRADVEVAQPFGFSSHAPVGGAVATLLQLGGDAGNPLLHPISNAYARFGGLQEGETVMYGSDGSRVHIRQGGAVEVWSGSSVTVFSKTTVINAPNGCTINGDVTIVGSLTTTQDVSDSHGSLDRLRGNYNRHTNPDGGNDTPTTPDPE